MRNQKRPIPIRVLLGGLLGAVLAPMVVCFGWGSWVGIAEGVPVGAFGLSFLMVFRGMASAFGSAEAAAVVQSLLGALLGGLVASATLPFAEDGKTLVKRSLLHYLATEAAFLLLILVCRWVDGWWIPLFYSALLTLLYLLIWLGRWTGWYLEVVELRELLGLDPGPTPLKWRETLPYLPFVLVLCDLLPAALRGIEHMVQADVPALSGLILPFLLLPVVSFCVGLSLGKRQGLCPLFPMACFVCYLPMVYLLFNESALFHCFMTAVPALVGNVLGALRQKSSAKHDAGKEDLP